MAPADPALLAAARAVHPDEPWDTGTWSSGAFHDVLVSGAGSVARFTKGDRAQERSVREAEVISVLARKAWGVAVPRLLDGPTPVPGSSAWMTICTRVAGETLEDLSACDARRLDEYARLLDDLRAGPPDLVMRMPGPRSWCGGDRWPSIVENDLAGLLGTAGGEAVARASAVVEVEKGIAPVLCHGDFGPHNILWGGAENVRGGDEVLRDGAESLCDEAELPLGGAEAVALIDLDAACAGDPAIDIAPLIGFHGADAVASLCTAEELDRAMVHRASLSLQVAAGAHLAGLVDLRDHALANFARRLEEGTLYDPRGGEPEQVC